MKIFVVLLLFVSATAAFNEWIGLPEDEPFLVRRTVNPSKANLASLFQSTHLNDHGKDEYEGSGIPGPDPDKEAMEEMVDSLHAILPAIKILKKARDEQNEEYSLQLTHALKHAPNDGQIKAVFGRQIMALHQRCIAIKVAFAREAHASGLFKLIKNDVLDLHTVMGYIIAAAHRRYFDIFEVFAHLTHYYDLHNHPGVQAIMTIGQMVADAACEGMFGKIKEIIDNQGKEGDFDFKDKITPAIYLKKSKICPGDLMKLLKKHQHESPKARFLNIVFENCKEVRYIRFAAGIVVDGIKLSKKVESMKKLEMERLNDMIKEVSDFMKDKKIKEAHIAVADYVLTSLRRAIMVSVPIEKKLKSSHPKPSDDSPNPGPAPETPAAKSIADIIEDESINDLSLVAGGK